MTVLVTGGAGYIGSHTVHDLVDAGNARRGLVPLDCNDPSTERQQRTCKAPGTGTHFKHACASKWVGGASDAFG